MIWNATDETSETAPLITAPSLLEIRGCFQYSGSADSCSAVTYVGLFGSAFGEKFPTARLGPAQVALLNGEAMISETDAVDAKAAIGRTYSSLSDGTISDGVFGPGWSDPTILSANSDTAASIIDNRSKDGTFVVVNADGGSQTFTATTGGVFTPLEPTGDATKLTFAAGTGGGLDTLTLSRPLGTGTVVTTWEWKTSDTGDAPEWTVKETDPPGTGNDMAVNSTGQRPTFVRVSDPSAFLDL
ncbi:hypothetical protein G5V59_20180 [Nocardioides sp. W3-2-3]|uniref:hypothetical protein n=1 Tax=Nocardioides convexus TaxID=2712224 RepID=UPI0024185DF7|nr:hypothetical protein [Nocardioides convexus]NHA01380.1 hypothetical protein [Nocardioides convexus]